MDPSNTSALSPADSIAHTWTGAALTTEPADHDRAEDAARTAYRDAGLPEPTQFIWCPSPWAALEHIESLIVGGQSSLVTAVRRTVLKQALSAARVLLVDRASDTERFSAFGEFHSFFERKGFYGEQRYDGMDERYDLMERPYRCPPVLPSERSALRPVLHAVHHTYRYVLRPMWSAIGRSITARFALQPVWYWADEHGLVDQDDEARAVIRYSTPGLNDQFFDPAWCYWPDLMVLAAIDTYRGSLGVGPDPAWQGCRDVALTSGPWWPFPDTAVMIERPILLTLDEQGRLHGDDGPAVQWADGHPVWASEGTLIGTAPSGPTSLGA
ncbi:DUF6745 domain-containing protein [Micromonospora arborensis]|uniref:DUF6745 domain-containing protein n=1 Tax=Micromonospora arborensis TaxID=2116518 RepID=UPI00340F47D2